MRVSLAVASALAALAVLAPAAFAGVSLSVVTNFPVTATVGQTGVSASLQVANQSNGAEATGTVTINAINLVPACGTTSSVGSGDCPAAFADPGVFQLGATGSGQAATACAGLTFTISIIDAATGQVTFTPSAPVVLQPHGAANDSCVIVFNFDVLKAPTKDADPGTPGLQTAQLGFAQGTHADGTPGGGFGFSLVTVAQAQPGLTTTATPTATVGSPITDTAHLTAASPPGPAPTGTITFRLFGAGDAVCANAPAFTSTVAVNHGTGDYTSAPFTPTSPGTYRWVASYSGDANNAAAATACNDANETTTVTQAPTLSTTASAPVLAGGTISDSGVLAGGFVPTGTITYTVFGPNNPTCTGAAAFTSMVTVTNGNGTYNSGPFTPAAQGSYNFVAVYSGDVNNVSVTSPCGALNESTTVGKVTPTISTIASGTVPLGGTIQDTATLSGGVSPTGTIIFTVFGPNNATCSATPAFTTTVPVNGNGGYKSGPFTPTSPGTYRFIAAYSGDTANNSVTTLCSDPSEATIVSPASPTITTTASGPVPLGGTIQDTATLSGGVSPTGTITFNVFGPNDATCSGTPAFMATITVNGNGQYTTPPFTPTSPGTYRFVATYSGDANNTPTGPTACNDPAEAVVVTAPVPQISVTKAASPLSRVEPGGTFTFTVTVSNPSASDPIKITSLVDNVYGDLATRAGSTCGTLIGVVLAPGATSSPCTFTGTFTGKAGASQTDIVTATGVDSSGTTATATAQATVTLTPAPPKIAVTKTAAPVTMAQPGGTFTFTITVSNPSTLEPVTITKLVDNVYGDLATRAGSTCGTLIGVVLAPGAKSAPCSFTGPFAGKAGDSQTDTVTVTGSNLGTTVTATAQATVSLVAAPLAISTQVTPATTTFGSSFQDAATLGPAPAGAVAPTGTVTFTVYGPDNATCMGTPAFTSTNPVGAGGTSATSDAFAPAALGTYRVVATYTGDANYQGSTTNCGDPGETVVITRAPTTTTVSVAPGSPTFGQSVTYTAQVAPVPPATGTPTGTVTFSVDGKTVGSRPLSPAGTASISIGPLPSGPHTVTASYSGDGTFLPSSGTLTYSVGCDVTITGVHNGALEVRSSVCIAPGAEVTGAIIVHDGGSLEVESAKVDGSILANGVSGAIRICGSSIGGAVDIKNSTGPVTVGSANDASCAPNQIGGALIVKYNTGGVDVGGNASGAVIVKGNSGPPPFSGVGTNAPVNVTKPGAASTTGSGGNPGGVGQTLARACGTAHLGAGGPLSKLPVFSVIVSAGSTSCATGLSVLKQFSKHPVKHAKILGFSCTRISATGLAHCVKGATTITDKRVRR